jgi:phenylpropionate dioxygenase-like ring-hydroxylating dioxygenase large terminal subunit
MMAQCPLKPEQMPTPDPVKDFKLEFIFPNLWQNYIGEKVRIMVAFVPVDQENTILYLRFYQKFMRVPVLRRLVTRLAMPYNLIITHQDRRVVVTQQPKASALQIGEHRLFYHGNVVYESQDVKESLASFFSRTGFVNSDSIGAWNSARSSISSTSSERVIS